MKLRRIATMGLAVGMMMGALTVNVNAATIEAGKTYKVNANLYVPKAYNPVMTNILDAYFTSTSMPPSSGLSNQNATLTVDADGDGKLKVELPIYNSDGDGLSLKTLGAITNTKILAAVPHTESATCSGGHTYERVEYITFTIDDVISESGTQEYTFGETSIHAKINMLSIQVKDTETTVEQAKLKVNYDNISEAE